MEESFKVDKIVFPKGIAKRICEQSVFTEVSKMSSQEESVEAVKIVHRGQIVEMMCEQSKTANCGHPESATFWVNASRVLPPFDHPQCQGHFSFSFF